MNQTNKVVDVRPVSILVNSLGPNLNVDLFLVFLCEVSPEIVSYHLQ